ncbi:hypothetical protein [Mycolicibacterium sp. S3B2]|uniref:hypothetical protein n=1 Tax=Mycolicibacterium sp. S3B2 TaxID=3415120 RepID=UPI003C7E3607
MPNNQPMRRDDFEGMSSGDLAAFQMGMTLFQQPQIKKRHHRREVHLYEDHRTIVEEITEEY